jgi:dTDP-4-amino-4,6-dideoxygalactose transaminase
MIPYNKPFISGNELSYIADAVGTGKISGDGKYTSLCQAFLERRYGYQKTLLTTSCTDALEMCALLCNIQSGDEVIAPSYTFVSSVNPFVLRGAVIKFCDSRPDHPGIDENKIEALITGKTKAIIVTHYAGIACDMDRIMSKAREHDLAIIEDAAHSIDSFYKDKPLGSIGDMAAFSFHETKNIIAGEGGMIVLNNPLLMERAEIIREKGTDRSKFFRGEVDKYGWVDVGSSFLPSDITAAFLYAQLENIDTIQTRRKVIWEMYNEALGLLASQGKIQLPHLPVYATNNGHIFYFLCNSEAERDGLINYLKQQGILAIFHYLPLHKSVYFKSLYLGEPLPMSEKYASQLVRLPLFYTLTSEEQQFIIDAVIRFYANR